MADVHNLHGPVMVTANGCRRTWDPIQQITICETRLYDSITGREFIYRYVLSKDLDIWQFREGKELMIWYDNNNVVKYWRATRPDMRSLLERVIWQVHQPLQDVKLMDEDPLNTNAPCFPPTENEWKTRCIPQTGPVKLKLPFRGDNETELVLSGPLTMKQLFQAIYGVYGQQCTEEFVINKLCLEDDEKEDIVRRIQNGDNVCLVDILGDLNFEGIVSNGLLLELSVWY